MKYPVKVRRCSTKIANNKAAGTAHDRDAKDRIKFQKVVEKATLPVETQPEASKKMAPMQRRKDLQRGKLRSCQGRSTCCTEKRQIWNTTASFRGLGCH